MSWLVGSGRVIDLILAVTVIEAVLLTVLYRTQGKGVNPGEFAVNLLSGCCLLLAMRGYVSAAPWPLIALCLLGAGTAHAIDLARRWRWSDARK